MGLGNSYSYCSTNENSPNTDVEKRAQMSDERKKQYSNLNAILDKINKEELFRYSKQELQVYD